MLKLRLAILGATAALALGTATALAMTGAIPFGDGDSHGDAVASAARSCPHGAGVSSVARTNGSSEANEDNGSQPAFVKACKAARATTGGDKHGHRGIGACVSAHAKAQAGSGDSSESESDSGS